MPFVFSVIVKIDDDVSARKDEIAALGGKTATGINVFSAFDDRLKEIREYNRKHPVARVVDANDDSKAILKEEPQIEFSGEMFCRIARSLILKIQFGTQGTSSTVDNFVYGVCGCVDLVPKDDACGDWFRFLMTLHSGRI